MVMAKSIYERRRSRLAWATVLGGIGLVIWVSSQFGTNWLNTWQDWWQHDVGAQQSGAGDERVLALLENLPTKGRAPKTGYSRQQFGNGWANIDGCSMRNLILKRDLTQVKIDDRCRVQYGLLSDPYTGNDVEFKYGASTSGLVQIDHVVAISDAWQKGAQQLTQARREEFYNDPINLLAVSGAANQAKSDADAASWLPANKAFRCQYIARQIQVKAKYDLWVTEAERSAMVAQLKKCPAS